MTSLGRPSHISEIHTHLTHQLKYFGQEPRLFTQIFLFRRVKHKSGFLVSIEQGKVRILKCYLCTLWQPNSNNAVNFVKPHVSQAHFIREHFLSKISFNTLEKMLANSGKIYRPFTKEKYHMSKNILNVRSH